MFRRSITLILVLAALATAVAASPAAAKRRGGTGCSSPTLTGPASARVGDPYTVNGCGFTPGSIVPLEIAEAGGCCLALNKLADSSGRFSYSSTVWGAGLYRVRASVRSHNRWRVAASWSFQASP